MKTLFANKTFFRFLIVGSLNTLSGYFIYLLFLLFVPYNIAYIGCYIVNVFVSYLFNLLFVFKEKHSLKKSMQFPFVYVAQFIFGLVALNLLVSIMGIGEKYALLIIVIVSTPATYLLMRMILMSKKISDKQRLQSIK
jgi:putative flippase GtrA